MIIPHQISFNLTTPNSSNNALILALHAFNCTERKVWCNVIAFNALGVNQFVISSGLPLQHLLYYYIKNNYYTLVNRPNR